MTLVVLSVAALVVSLLVGSGAVGFFIKYGIRLAILEKLFDDKKRTLSEVKTGQEGMQTRLALVESAISKIEQMREDMMPRKEIESRFDALEELIKLKMP